MEKTRREFLKGAAAFTAFGAASGLLAGCSASNGNGGQEVDAITWDLETDVVVAGFGYAGCAAAINAAEEGAQVLVLEKAPEEYAGGDSSCSGGGNGFCTEDAEEECFQYERPITPYDTVSDAELRAYIHEMATGTQWKLDHDAGDNLIVSENAGGMLKTAPHAAGLNQKEYSFGNGYGQWLWISAVAEGLDNVTVMYETPLSRLIFDPETKEVFGVIALDNQGTPLRIKARKGVVLATGGFSANQEMISAFIAPNIPMFTVGSPYCTGDGILIVEEVGAKLRSLSSVEWGNHCCRQASEEIGVGIGYRWHTKDIMDRTIFVNAKGQRFVNETTGVPLPSSKTLHPAMDKTQIPELDLDMQDCRYANIPMYLITDAKRLSSGALFNGANADSVYQFPNVRGMYTWSEDNQAEVECGWLKMGNTPEELALELGVDPQGLEETLSRYNADVAAGEDSQFGRVDAFTAVDKGPYYGCEMGMGLIATLGGPVRDEYHRVIGADGNPIPRLYSGGAFGSIWGFLYPGAQNVPEAFSTRMAGTYAAQLDSWEDVEA